jgi:regulatory protein
MPTITKIAEQKRRPNRRNIFLDGAFAFGCNVNVVAKFRLRPGMQLSDEQVRAVEQGEVKQEAFDAATHLLRSRLHSAAEVRRKLSRKEYGNAVVDAVIADLARMGYLDDAQFAKAKADLAARHKQHGRRRAKTELLRAGVAGDVADHALAEVYGGADTLAVARELAHKQAPRLRKLDKHVARRRLVGMLQRRGFEYDEIKPVVDEVLGARGENAE